MNLVNGWNRYWHEFGVDRSRVVAFRVVFFGLLAFDLWTNMIVHAPRYGAGEFNVAHFGLLDALPLPTTAVVTAAWLMGGFFAFRAAFGVALRTSIIGTTVCYAGVYFWSQADSYQHHYLVSMILIALCFVPTQHLRREPPSADATPTTPTLATHWALRLLYVQVALLYGWAAVGKMDSLWLDGITMRQLSGGAEVRAFMTQMAERLGTDNIYAFAAWGVMLGELFAFVVFMWRKLWTLGWLVIVWFHVGVEILDYKIEWFSYFMFAITLLLLAPKRVVGRPGALALASLSVITMPFTGIHADASWLPVHVVFIYVLAVLPDGMLAPVSRVARAFGRMPLRFAADNAGLRWGTGVVVAGVALGCGLSIPLEGVEIFAVAAAVFGLLAQGFSPRPLAALAGQTLALGSVLAWMSFTAVPYDYYRLWGGDLKRRQQFEMSAWAYKNANAIQSTGPARAYQLGQVYDKLNRPEDALAAYEDAVNRYQAELPEATRAVFQAPANADPLVALGDLHAGLESRCRALSNAYREAGRDDKADTHRTCAANSRRDALEAYTKALTIAPAHPGARQGQRAVKRAR